MKFSTIDVDVPEHDCDIVLKFPTGEIITIQARPSNAETDYNGSLDIILPKDQPVTNWLGDDMAPSPKVGKTQCCRLAKQLVMELP